MMVAFAEQDQSWMSRAIDLAKLAEKKGEVPVGAVIVLDDQVIGEGFNQPIILKDPTAHAEIIALRQASQCLQNYRLPRATLYVTLEPCMMCAGAMVHARIERLVFGAYDKKSGAITSVAKTLDYPFLNHRVSYQGGLLSDSCGQLLSQFFATKRTLNRLASSE